MYKINLRMFILTLIVSVASVQATAGSTKLRSEDTVRTDYWVPKNPPKAHYKIECSIHLSEGSIKGIERIRFRNSTSRPISRLKINWISLGNMEIRSGGKAAKILSKTKTGADLSILIELAKPVYPSKKAELDINFAATAAEYADKEEVKLSSWHPRLDWGVETHDDYDVKIDKTSEYLLATSGVLASRSGYYHAENVREFGLFLGKGNKVIKANAEDVLVQVVFKPEAEKCAHLILDTAVDVINFYRQRFGFYPYQSLSIVPGGMDRPAGGYPIATSLVAIHAMEQMDTMPEVHWRWITAHEVGHQYWLEHVLTKDSHGWGWLMIGLGVYADREYSRARGLGPEKHQGMMGRYIRGVREGLDTTMNRSEEELRNIKFDFNNVVTHGKGYSVISALDCILGKNVFDRIYKRCLKKFGGRRLGVHEFRAVCEEESQQDLGWFFDQWVNSNRYLSYEISNKKCTKQGKRYITEVEVKCLGDLKMPVPVAAYYEDGSSEVKFTSRLLETNTLEFISDSPLKEVKLDAENELALIVPPPSGDSKVLDEILQLPWSGAGDKALELYKKAKQLEAESEVWYKLGLNLYDGKHYTEALEVFRSIITAPDRAAAGEFMSLVWQGHLLDIFERRAEALQCYRKALDVHTEAGLNDFKVRHDQYKMVINRAWVEERIEKPFVRESSKKDETKQAVSNLKVLDIEFEPIRQGKNVVRVKVKNTSQQDQILRIHIYTRSPRLGRSGVGWGAPFYDTIKEAQTKQARFVFKIQGKITDDTWLRLSFSNPDSKQDSESKKFLEKRYTSKDLPRKISGTKPVNEASKDQTEEAFNVFKSMQSYIKKAEYEATWGMFTKDYQEAEFHGKFDMFQKAMNKVMPWSSFYWDKDVFLTLKPVQTVLSGDKLVLDVASEDARWTVDLVEVDGKWKIDWIGDYTAAIVLQANWQERLFPKMGKRSTEHFDIYYFKDSTAENEIDQIAERREKGFEEICRFLGKDSDVRICMVFFEDGKTKQLQTGHTGAGWAYGTTIVEIYNEEQKLDPYHETTHILMNPVGNPPALFNEGFAVYMSERLGARGAEYLIGKPTTVYNRVRELKAKGDWVELHELLTYTEIGSSETRPPISYPEAGAFVKFLIDKYGKDKFLRAYKTLKNSNDKTVHQQNIETLKKIYGKSLAELEKEWEIAFR